MIRISIPSQTLSFHCPGQATLEFPISTAINGTGQQSGSHQTPLGYHQIDEIIGLETPIYTQFTARKPVAYYKECPKFINNDMILTRIIRLKGMSPGINSGFDSKGHCVDSFQRYIYIHGTNNEEQLGQPVSHGCIRMGNRDIICLCDLLQPGVSVMIDHEYTLEPSW